MTDHLHALAMRTKAAELCVEYSTHHGTGMFEKHSSACAKAILALPLEADHAALVAEAVKLPEIAALIETLKKADQALHDDGCRPTMWPRPQIAAALLALEPPE